MTIPCTAPTSAVQHAPRAFATGLLALALALSSLPSLVAAAPLAPGAAMPALALADQHDKPVQLQPDTRWVVFAAEKPVSDMVNGLLAAEPAGVLARWRALYVADISGMPSLVTRMFALPRLRELPFPIGLMREPGPGGDWPRRAGHATVLQLEAGQVVHVHYAADAQTLRQMLAAQAN